MLLADIVKAEKHELQIGGWQSGPVPNASFPLRGTGKLSLGTGYEWRVVKFIALGSEFVLLLKLSREKETYAAILGLRDEKKLKVICHHELHTSHRGWHCHMVSGNVLDTFTGVLRDKNAMKVRIGLSDRATSSGFEVTKDNALSIAAARFRFAYKGSLI